MALTKNRWSTLECNNSGVWFWHLLAIIRTSIPLLLYTPYKIQFENFSFKQWCHMKKLKIWFFLQWNVLVFTVPFVAQMIHCKSYILPAQVVYIKSLKSKLEKSPRKMLHCLLRAVYCWCRLLMLNVNVNCWRQLLTSTVDVNCWCWMLMSTVD